MSEKNWLRRAHADENKRVGLYWSMDCPSLRIPISGAGRFKTDVFAVVNGAFNLELVRRTEPRICPRCKGKKIEIKDRFGNDVSSEKIKCIKCSGKGKISADIITFFKEEIEDAFVLAKKLTERAHIPTQVILVGHFPRYRTWKTKHLINWDGKDVVINV